MIRMGVIAVAIGAAVGAQQDVPKAWVSAWMPIDGEAMCAMLTKELRGRPMRAVVTVTSATPVEKKTDSYEVFIMAGVEGAAPRIDLVMGPLHVHGDGAAVRAVHTREPGTVFGVAVGEQGVMETISTNLPPIPMPQVWMAMWDGPEGKCPPLGAYFGAVEWVKSEMGVDASPPRVRMYGRAAESGAIVELHATLEPVRIERFVVADEKTGSVIEVKLEPLEEGALPPEDAMEGRTKVGSVGELVR